MLFNYLKIAFRNLSKHTGYSAINIAGLSVGIASSILIMLWVVDELSYDRFHTNFGNLYQVHKNQEFADGISTDKPLPLPLMEAIEHKVSEVKSIVVSNWGEGSLLAVGEVRVNKMGYAVSEDFLSMFSFDVLQGNAATALADPNSIVLTESTAKALFGATDALNKTVKIDNGRDLRVAAITSDVPAQSSLTFEYLLPFSYYESVSDWVRNSRTSWENNSFQMYVLLHPDASLESANAAIRNLIKENNKEQQTAQLFLYPISQWRLYSQFENGKPSGGMIEYVELFSAIAIFVLIIACINFMNLATARSESRAREVGIRKSIGSRRKELIAQFLGESIFITLLAFLVALVLVELSLPLYNSLVNKTLSINYTNPWLWVAAGLLVVVVGLAAGSYPAFYLSSFQPVKVLKGKVHVGKGASTPRKVLVTLQFGFSILLLVGTIVIYQQIQHVKDREVGYDRENLMMIWTSGEIERNFSSVREELLRTGVVKSVAHSNSPVTAVFSSNVLEWRGMPAGARVNFTTIATEYDYTETMGIKMVEGRDFSRDFKSDSTSILVNQAAVDVMGLPNPLGEKLKMWGREWNIIGVMENVLMDSPFQPIAPLVAVFQPDWSSTLSIRLEKTADLKGAIARVETVMKKMNPAYPFSYRFADWDFEKKFASINLISRLSGIFAGLAIFITCLGLFGLASFTAEQRTKEIGIRKVMGATVSGLVMLIASDFSRLVLIAFSISAPMAWWALNSFLEQYPYRVPIHWWVLPLAGFIALFLAILIVSTQALRAALTNPTQSLRSE